MPTFSLVSELTLATVSVHLPNSDRTSVVACLGGACCGVERIQRYHAAINLDGGSESDTEGGARGRSSIRWECGRNGHRSFRILWPRGRAPSETPYMGPVQYRRWLRAGLLCRPLRFAQDPARSRPGGGDPDHVAHARARIWPVLRGAVTRRFQ